MIGGPRPLFEDMLGAMATIFCDVWGQWINISVSGRDEPILVAAIYRRGKEISTIGSHGVEQVADYDKLDIRRDDLIRAGLTDPESDLHDATFELDGRVMRIEEPRDDYRALVKCRLSLV